MTATAEVPGVLTGRSMRYLEGPTRRLSTPFDIDEGDEPFLADKTSHVLLSEESEWRKIADSTISASSTVVLSACPFHARVVENLHALVLAESVAQSIRQAWHHPTPTSRLSSTIIPLSSLTVYPPTDSPDHLLAVPSSRALDFEFQSSIEWLDGSTPDFLAEYFEALWRESFKPAVTKVGAVDASITLNDVVPPKRRGSWLSESAESASLGSLLTSSDTPAAIENPIAERILEQRAITAIDPQCNSIADAAVQDALNTVRRNGPAGTPLVMFSEDGILSLQWDHEEYGVGLIFAGDGLASIVFRRPGQFYAENGIEVPAAGNLPQSFKDALAKILRS
jgi:hypothetical protein